MFVIKSFARVKEILISGCQARVENFVPFLTLQPLAKSMMLGIVIRGILPLLLSITSLFEERLKKFLGQLFLMMMPVMTFATSPSPTLRFPSGAEMLGKKIKNKNRCAKAISVSQKLHVETPYVFFSFKAWTVGSKEDRKEGYL